MPSRWMTLLQFSTNSNRLSFFSAVAIDQSAEPETEVSESHVDVQIMIVPLLKLGPDSRISVFQFQSSHCHHVVMPILV